MDFFDFSPGRAFASVGMEKSDQSCLRGMDQLIFGRIFIPLTKERGLP